MLSALLARASGVEVPISFYARDGAFQRSQKALLKRLAPHLRTAVRVQLQVGALQHSAGALADVVDRVGVGVLTVAADGRVVWANRLAEGILDERDGLRLRDGRLECLRRKETAALEAAITPAAGLDDRAAVGQAVSVARRSRRRGYVLAIAPLPSAGGRPTPPGDIATRRAAAVVTPAEARLLASVAGVAA